MAGFKIILGLAIATILLKSNFVSSICDQGQCEDKPVIEDFCYGGATGVGGVRWKPPDCMTVDRYAVVYAPTRCSYTLDAPVETVTSTNETTIFLPPSDVYCIQVRAVINENCYSMNSTCAQVASVRYQLCKVMMHGEVCLPLSTCTQHTEDEPLTPSHLIIISKQKQSHLPWDELEARHNAIVINNNGSWHACFYNVTESFAFVEYCDWIGSTACGNTLCCSNWAEFVSKACVNVAGDEDGGCLDSLQKPLPAAPTGIKVTTEYDSNGLIQISSQINIVPSVHIPGAIVDGSISNYTFTYIDGSGSPPTFVVPSANCSGGVCQHVFPTPTSSVPPSYTVSVMATNVAGEGPATSSQLIPTNLNSSLEVVVLPNNTMQCQHNGLPITDCLVKYGTDPTYSDLPNTDSAVEDGVITLTSKLTESTIYYTVSTTNMSLTMKFSGSFNTCITQELIASNVTFQPQSSCVEPREDDPLACYSGVTPGSTVMYYCTNSSYAKLSGQFTRTCHSDGSWNGTKPSCVCNASLAVAPTVANAEVSVVVSADFRKANATYSTEGIYTISENQTLVFDCDSQFPEWTPAPPQVTLASWFIAIIVVVTAVLLILIAVVATVVMKWWRARK